MGACMVCASGLAEKPYRIPEVDITIYSVEELCYYIRHNIVLLQENFVNEELLTFIGEELGLLKSALRIKKSVEDKNTFLSVLVGILQEFHYFDEREIKQFRREFEDFHKLPAHIRALQKGDFLFEEAHYGGALEMYKSILQQMADGRPDPAFVSLVYQHKAVACIRLGLFEGAMESLGLAYKARPSDDLLKDAFRLSLYSGTVMDKDMFLALNGEEEYVWRQDYEDLKNREALEARTSPALGMFTKEGRRKREAIQAYLQAQKDGIR